MIPQSDLDKMDLDTIDKEIKSRKVLLTQMVGSLYPSIILDEMDQLYHHKTKLVTEVNRDSTERSSNGSSQCS